MTDYDEIRELEPDPRVETATTEAERWGMTEAAYAVTRHPLNVALREELGRLHPGLGADGPPFPAPAVGTYAVRDRRGGVTLPGDAYRLPTSNNTVLADGRVLRTRRTPFGTTFELA